MGNNSKLSRMEAMIASLNNQEIVNIKFYFKSMMLKLVNGTAIIKYILNSCKTLS